MQINPYSATSTSILEPKLPGHISPQSSATQKSEDLINLQPPRKFSQSILRRKSDIRKKTMSFEDNSQSYNIYIKDSHITFKKVALLVVLATA